VLWLVPVLFAGALGATSLLVRRDPAFRAVAAHLWVVWTLANAAWLSNTLWALPILDLGLGVALIDLWWKVRTRWVALLVHACSARLILHVLDAGTGHLFFVPYAHALNATFAWMLVVVAFGGGCDHRLDTDTLRRRLRDVRRALRPASCAAQRP
jgi:hypothetical protein